MWERPSTSPSGASETTTSTSASSVQTWSRRSTRSRAGMRCGGRWRSHFDAVVPDVDGRSFGLAALKRAPRPSRSGAAPSDVTTLHPFLHFRSDFHDTEKRSAIRLELILS